MIFSENIVFDENKVSGENMGFGVNIFFGENMVFGENKVFAKVTSLGASHELNTIFFLGPTYLYRVAKF